MNLKLRLLRAVAVVFITFLPIWLILVYGVLHRKPNVIISPVPEGQIYITPSPTIKPPVLDPDPVKEAGPSGQKAHRGKASFYSRAGCLGCSKTLTMANGEPLDDSRLTVAFNRAPINHVVTVTNMINGKSVRAKVTDRGGFERHGKIIDLTIATRDALGCGHVCDVEVSL